MRQTKQPFKAIVVYVYYININKIVDYLHNVNVGVPFIIDENNKSPFAFNYQT